MPELSLLDTVSACDQGAEITALAGLNDSLQADLANLIEVLASQGVCPPAQQAAPAPFGEPSPLSERRAALAAMAEALGTGKPRACKAAAEPLRNLAWPPGQEETVAEICALAKRFDYQTALERAKALLKQFEDDEA